MSHTWLQLALKAVTSPKTQSLSGPAQGADRDLWVKGEGFPVLGVLPRDGTDVHYFLERAPSHMPSPCPGLPQDTLPASQVLGASGRRSLPQRLLPEPQRLDMGGSADRGRHHAGAHRMRDRGRSLQDSAMSQEEEAPSRRLVYGRRQDPRPKRAGAMASHAAPSCAGTRNSWLLLLSGFQNARSWEGMLLAGSGKFKTRHRAQTLRAGTMPAQSVATPLCPLHPPSSL